MKTLTKAEARAGAMTKEEACTATVERALQLEGSAIALLCREAITVRRKWINSALRPIHPLPVPPTPPTPPHPSTCRNAGDGWRDYAPSCKPDHVQG